jgi:hypothetical protein
MPRLRTTATGADTSWLAASQPRYPDGVNGGISFPHYPDSGTIPSKSVTAYARENISPCGFLSKYALTRPCAQARSGSSERCGGTVADLSEAHFSESVKLLMAQSRRFVYLSRSSVPAAVRLCVSSLKDCRAYRLEALPSSYLPLRSP